MPTYVTPGTYYERVDSGAPAISPVRVDVAGFAGIAERGPVDTPVPVESWRQFQAWFGGFIGSGFLAYAVKGFFENGGRRCWIVRVASGDPVDGAAPAGVTIDDAMGNPLWRIAASSAGSWGNYLSVEIRENTPSEVVAAAGAHHEDHAAVDLTDGIARGSLVRLKQAAGSPRWRVVSHVDAARGRVYWLHEDRKLRLSYDRAVTGFDPDRPLTIESITYSLLVRELGRLVAVYEGISLVPEHENYGAVILRKHRFGPGEDGATAVTKTPRPLAVEELRDTPLTAVYPVDESLLGIHTLTGGADGLRLLSPEDYIGEEVSALDDEETARGKKRGLRALESVEQAAMIAAPDIHIQPERRPPSSPLPPCIPDTCLPIDFVPEAAPVGRKPMELPPVFTDAQVYQIQAVMVVQCETLRNRIAILSPPHSAVADETSGIGGVRTWRAGFDSKYAAIYYPWLRVADPPGERPGELRAVPACGHVTGQFARTDFAVGVHKAAANAPLAWVQDVTAPTDGTTHGILNSLGINVIKTFPGRGIRIFGARTVSSDPDWRFINVRRLLIMIEKAVELSMQWAVFEPNDFMTRAKITLALTSYLTALWEQGALKGKTAEEAFFVKCNEENNPPSERGNGRLLAEVGVAPSKPFEFVVVRVGRTDNELNIAEE